MGGTAWLAAPASVVSLVLLGSLRGRKGSKKGKDDAARVSEDEGVSFTCERVCTSDALLTRLGGLTKARLTDPGRPCSLLRRVWRVKGKSLLALLTTAPGLAQEPTPGTCVTVCGTSGARC